MATKASDDEVCQSILDFVTKGDYPASEETTFSEELELISKAREQVEVSVLCLHPPGLRLLVPDPANL